jgi:hypothetical protein
MAFCRGFPHPKQQLLLNAQVDKGEGEATQGEAGKEARAETQ